MRIARSVLLLALLSLLGLQALGADPFDCGSTGAYGAITQGGTLNMPLDGIFHCTTINIPAGHTLSFTRNALNTPVYLLATGDVVINGTIDISGSGRLGGPGGFDGGKGGSVLPGLDAGGGGHGPGGGNYELPAFGTPPTGQVNPNTYGNLLLCPLIGGSGSCGLSGSPGEDGYGGGGAILIASNTRIIVNAGGLINSGASRSPITSLAGSGGAIRLVAPVVGGSGSLTVWGSGTGGWKAGNGRIRIDCLDNMSWRSLSLTSVASRGSRMMLFPTNAPQLDIIEVAGNPIPEGTNNAVLFELAVGASTNQTVTVQSRGFTNDVPIRVVVTPENGSRGEFDAVILQASGNPPSTNVPVVIPAGSACQIHAWTR